jgi:hypothetical protein
VVKKQQVECAELPLLDVLTETVCLLPTGTTATPCPTQAARTALAMRSAPCDRYADAEPVARQTAGYPCFCFHTKTCSLSLAGTNIFIALWLFTPANLLGKPSR